MPRYADVEKEWRTRKSLFSIVTRPAFHESIYLVYSTVHWKLS